MKKIQWIALVLVMSCFSFQGVSRAEESLEKEESSIVADTHVPEALDSGQGILAEVKKDGEEAAKDTVEAIPTVPVAAGN